MTKKETMEHIIGVCKFESGWSALLRIVGKHGWNIGAISKAEECCKIIPVPEDEWFKSNTFLFLDDFSKITVFKTLQSFLLRVLSKRFSLEKKSGFTRVILISQELAFAQSANTQVWH